MARRSRKNSSPLLEIIEESAALVFKYVPTGWAIPAVALLLGFVGYQAFVIRLPIVSAIVIVALGILPAVVILVTAHQAACRRQRPFLSFTRGDRAYEAHLDRVFAPATVHAKTARGRQHARPQRVAETPAPVVNPPVIEATRWSLLLINRLEWRRFEVLVEGLFRHGGEWTVEGGPAGPDGGIDLRLFRPGEPRPTAAIQCKAYRNKPVGVATVRELFGIMAAENIPHGMIFTCGEFSPDAENFARDKSIDLVTGPRLLALIGELPSESQKLLLKEVTLGDSITPTCPSCRVRMIRRTGSRGAFWGCAHYPRCRNVLHGAA